MNWRAAAMVAPLLFLWTNPPENDLAVLRFYVTSQDSSGVAYRFDFPIFTVDQGDTFWWTRPGEPDSAWINLPCRSRPIPYAASCTAIDTAGNESGPSNVISFSSAGGL